MFCGNCGNKIGESDAFCEKCGTKISQTISLPEENLVQDVYNKSLNSTDGTVPPPIPNAGVNYNNDTFNQNNPKRKKTATIIGVSVVAIIVILFLGIVGGNSAVRTVKNGKLEAYPEQTVGKAFEGFFGDTEWTSYEKDDETYVKFTGKCMYDDEDASVKMIFSVEDKSFYIESCKLNGVEIFDTSGLLYNAVFISLMEKIYE